jgi:hypothetical protein
MSRFLVMVYMTFNHFDVLIGCLLFGLLLDFLIAMASSESKETKP